jgi:LacI family transcriptional regulator
MGGRLIGEHLLGQGHRKIGVITVPEDMNFALNERYIGLCTACESYGIDGRDLPKAYGDFSTNGGETAAKQLMTDHPDLTVLISLNDRMALGAIRYLQSVGKQIPTEVSVTGYDDINLARLSSPALTTIDQNATQLGQQAARMLFEILKGGTPSSLNLPVELKVRATTAPPQSLR